MVDYVWPEDLAPFAMSFYLQPHTGRSESPFTRQQKVYGLSAPRWVAQMAFRGGYDGADGLEAVGPRLDALIVKLKGGQNVAIFRDFRRDNRGLAATASGISAGAVAAGAQMVTVSGFAENDIAYYAGDYIGGDGRVHIVTDDAVADSNGDAVVRFEPPMDIDLYAGLAILDAPTSRFRLTSNDGGANLIEVGDSAKYDLEFVEDLPSAGPLPSLWIYPNDYDGVNWTNALGVELYSDGSTIWPMLPDDATTLTGWRVGGSAPALRNPDDGLDYVAISLANRFDPTKQGAAVTQLYVNVNTGNNTTGDGTAPLPWKTVEKALTEINGGSDGVYQVNVITTDFIPGNSEGWNAATYTINAGKKVKLYFAPRGDGSKPWWLPGMRRTNYLKADFAWADIGDGWWKSTAVGISTAAKDTDIVFDLSVLDEDGMPTPSKALTGALADDAAVKAAAGDDPAFYYRSSDAAFYVKLASGDEPDPGNNFAYVETGTSNVIQLDETARFFAEGARAVHNAGVASGAIPFTVRPLTVTLNPTAPVVVHDIEAGFKDFEVYGSSGHAWHFFDVHRFALEGCKDGYCGLDGVAQSTFYTPGNSNDPALGMAQHGFVDDHLSLYHGPNDFKDQPAVNVSANTFTTHSRANLDVYNSRGGFSNGSGVAVVSGAKALLLNVYSHDPKNVTPATDVYPAAYLAGTASPYSSSIRAEIWGFYCGASVGSFAKTFYAGPTGTIIMAEYRGTYTKQVDSGGILQDGYGAAL